MTDRNGDRLLQTRVMASVQSAGDATAGMWTSCFYGGCYIAASVVMIAFNKYLVSKDRFPFAVPLVLLHSGVSSVLALLLFLIRPSMFPSLTCPMGRVNIDRDLASKLVLIAVLFATQLVLTNTAYLHSSMAFLQMMKEANLVVVYGLCLLAATETFSWIKCRVIFFILLATTMTIHGEINFSWTGFFIQGTGQFFESAKIVLQALLLSNVGKKLDVLTYVILVMPVCFLFLGSALLWLVFVHPLENLSTPYWSDIVLWWPQLLANACCAFALNVAIALFMKNSSAVAFILAGILKDAGIVTAGFFIMREPISVMQAFAFTGQLLFIWVWAVMKFYPERFVNGIIPGVVAVVTNQKEKNQLLPLAASDKQGHDDGSEDGKKA